MELVIEKIKKGYLKEFNYGEFQVLKKISDDSSEVIHAYMTTEKKHVVLKFLKEYNQDEYYKKFDREIANLKKISLNDNVIGFYGVTKEPLKKFYSMMLQYCSHKSLREHLEEKEVCNWTCKILMATEIATGLEYIHAANVVHCNLNSKNILMHHHNGKLMIIDFSSSMSLESQTEPTLKITENIAYVDPKFFNPTKDPIHLTPVDYKELYCDSWNSDHVKRPLINEIINRVNDIEFE
ncbi:950_t:CDS:2, partial [Dentiscutata heterogama]